AEPALRRGRRGRRQPGRTGPAYRYGGRPRLQFHRTAARLLHGQRRDDRARGRRTPGAGHFRSAGRTCPAALAAGRRGRQRQSDPCSRPQRRQGVKRAGIIGGGAWGAALAQVCARAGLETVLWAREGEVVASINTSHENATFLPGIALDPGIRATGDFADLAGADLVLAVAPAQHLRSTLTAFAPHAREGLPILLCSKGVEQGSLKLMTEVLAETVPQATPAVLSGPSFAGEVA